MPVTLTSHVSIRVLVALFLIQFPASESGNTVEVGPNAEVPATHVGNLDKVPVSWLQPHPAKMAAGFWGVNQ